MKFFEWLKSLWQTIFKNFKNLKGLDFVYSLIGLLYSVVKGEKSLDIVSIADLIVGNNELSFTRDSIIKLLDDVLKILYPVIQAATPVQRFSLIVGYLKTLPAGKIATEILGIAVNILKVIHPEINDTKAISAVQAKFLKENPDKLK